MASTQPVPMEGASSSEQPCGQTGRGQHQAASDSVPGQSPLDPEIDPEIRRAEAIASAPPIPPSAAQRAQALIRRALGLLLWGSLFVGTAATSALVGAGVALMMPLPSFIGGENRSPVSLGDFWKSGFRYQVTRPVNILVMGIDEVLDAPAQSKAIFAGRTDTLLLVRVNPQDKTLKVISIPRDTRVQIPGYGMAKINHANVEGGPELVAETIAYNLGDVQIDRYIRVNTTAFREIVDLIGGIEVDVPRRMHYTDKTQGLYIDLYPGWQTLNGDQAEQFARFRKDDGDIGRVQRQQILLKAFRERLTNPVVLPKLPQAIRVVQRYIDTNLTFEEMLALANFGLNIEPDQLQMVMLPGRFSDTAEYDASYWLPDWEASATILQTFFQTQSVGLYADHSRGRYVADLNIAVENASGIPQAGAAVAQHLGEQGFKNVYLIPNRPTTTRHTEVIAQKGDLQSARTLQLALGIGQVLSESTGDLRSDITIRIGQDWLEQPLKPSRTGSF